MFKKTLFLIFVVVLALTSVCFAPTWISTSNNRWDVAGNWSGGIPSGTPTSDSEALFNQSGKVPCLVDSATTATPGRISINSNNAVLNVTGGSCISRYNTGRLTIGSGGYGTLNVSGGTVTGNYALHMGRTSGGHGTINVSGTGMVKILANLSSGSHEVTRVATEATNTSAVINVNGGTFHSELDVEAGASGVLLARINVNGGVFEVTGGTTPNHSHTSHNMTIGRGGGAADVNITGGTISVSGNLTIGSGSGSTGTITMTGGTISVVGNIILGASSATGTIYFDGGTISAGNVSSIGTGSIIEFGSEDAIMLLGGDDRTAVNDYITAGKFIQTVGVGYYFVYDYNPGTNTTTVYVSSPFSEQATFPSPANGAGNVDPNANLSWTPGIWADSHDVYFGTNYDGVANATPASAEFQNNVEPNTFEPGTLDFAKTYYWRIDEVNILHPSSPLKGNVWSFSVVEWQTDDYPPVILVDSTETLANEGGDRSYTSYGEWNTNGNYEGWTVTNAASSSVSGGILSATENIGGSPMTLDIPITTGPLAANLDYGFKEKLQIRCKIPAGFTGEFKFQYKTTFRNSYTEDKVFAIPAGTLIADDAWHTYILDLVLERNFRGDLQGFKLTPFSGVTPNGRTVQIDFIRLGDLLSDTIQLNTDLPFYPGETLADCNNVQSKHFVIWWSPQTDVLYGAQYGPYETLTTRHRYNLRCLEETYQYIYRVLGYDEPFYDTDGSTPGRFKNFVTTWHEGGWMSNYHGFTYNNYGPADKDTAGNPIRHEYGHCVQGVMQGFLNGRHWESHDGYMHTASMAYWGKIQDEDMQVNGYLTWVNYVPKTVHFSNLKFEARHFVYADRRPYWYLDFDPDNLGFQHSFCVQMWATGNKDEFFHTALLRELPPEVDYEDVVLGWSRRWRFFDADPYEYMRKWYFHNPSDSEETKLSYIFRHTMMLIPCPDKPGWWRSSIGSSPQKMAYSFYELDGAPGQTVTATMRMMDLPGTSESLRWCLVAADTDFLNAQKPRYSGFWKPGETHNFTLNSDEYYLYLVVAGTPNPIQYNLEPEENAINLDKHPLTLRYHFEVNLTNTQPKIESLNVYTRGIGTGHAHSNGGGCVENTATVDSTAYVGPNASVLGTAQVLNNARIDGHATVINAKVKDNAQVSGRAFVYGSGTEITGFARVRDRAHVRSGADMSGNALICDHAEWITGLLKDNVVVRGVAWAYGNPTISGHAILDGDYVREWSPSDGVHKTNIPWDGATYYWDDYSAYLKKPVGLVARYRVEEADGEILQDTWGSMHALIRGTPTRVYDHRMNANVLSLNGSNQHVLLDSSIGDSTEMSFSGWCKITARVSGATLLYLGHSADKFIKLVPSNSSNKAALTIQRTAGQSLTLTSTTTLPLNEWAHIAFSTNGSNVKLYINGVKEAEGTFAFYPYEVITPDLQETAQANYIGRNWTGNYLAANLADLQFYNTAMTSTQVTDMFNQYGRMLGRFYKDTTYVSGSTVNTGIPSTLEGTIMVDVYAEDTGDVAQYRAIVDSWDYVASHYLQFQYGSGMPSIGVDNGKYVVMLQQYGRWNTNISCPLNTWQKVALTYTSSQAKLYINGSLAASINANQKYPAGAVYFIGGSVNTSVSPFIGSLQNIRIFDKAYSDVEITRLVLDLSPTSPVETTPPTPNPAEFSSAPAPVSQTEITMTATTGSDASPPVEYYFDETSGKPGGTDSGWQTSPTYTDTGLTPGTTYTYTVQMRDLWGNTGTASAPSNAKTFNRCDFNRDGIVDACDLQVLTNDWLIEYEPADPSLIAQWNFDEMEGTTAYDSIGTNHAAIFGGAGLNGTGFLTFDGSNDYALINRNISTSFTIAFFVKTTQTGSTPNWYNGRGLVDGEVGGSTNDFGTSLVGSKFGFGVGNPDTTITSNTSINNGAWHHVAATRNSTTGVMKVYVDGVMEKSASGPTGAKTSPSKLRFGCLQTNANFFAGSIDRVDIYNSVLDDSEIMKLSQGIIPSLPKQTDLYFDGAINFLDFAVFADNWLD